MPKVLRFEISYEGWFLVLGVPNANIWYLTHLIVILLESMVTMHLMIY